MKRGIGSLLSSGVVALAIWAFSSSGASAQIVNGGFETGDLTGWTQYGFLGKGGPTSGGPQYSTFATAMAAGTEQPVSPSFSGVIASQTTSFDGAGIISPGVPPTAGASLAFISNERSIGNNSLTGSSLAQAFVVPRWASTLTFDLMLLNNDSSGNFASYDDFAGVALLQGGAVVAQYNVDLNAASTANAHISSGVAKGGFRNSTPWLTVHFDIAPYAGQKLTFVAYALNYGGDNLGETRVLLDNVQFLTVAGLPGPTDPLAATPVPTLSTWTLALLGIILAASGALAMRRMRA